MSRNPDTVCGLPSNGRHATSNRSKRQFPLIAFFLLFALIGTLTAISNFAWSSGVHAGPESQATGQVRESIFLAGPSFNVGEIAYPQAHDFDSSGGVDTCLSLSVPPGDTFTLSLEWEPLVGEFRDAGDLDLYIYMDSSCTQSAVLTSSFNSNAYTGELLEVTPQVRNIGDAPAVAGVRIGKRFGQGNPGALTLKVLTGNAVFLEHGTGGRPLGGQEGAPRFEVFGPYSIPENSPTGTDVGSVVAVDLQGESVTYFELEPATGQTSFEIDPRTGLITVEDPSRLDRETVETLIYWIGVTDGTAVSVTGVGINLNGVNDNPPTALDGSTTTSTDTPVIIELLGQDADIDPTDQLLMSVDSAPLRGSLTVPVSKTSAAASVVYTPEVGFTGEDAFTFIVSDGPNISAPATITVTVGESGPSEPAATPGTGGSPPVTGAPSAPPAPEPTATPEFALNAVPPSVPRTVKAVAGDGSVLFTWQRPLSNGGAPIDGYRIFNVNTAQSVLVDGDIVEARVRGLENGTSYLFQVRAFNAAGFGEGTLVGPVTPIAGEPLTIEIDATVHPDDSVTIWWQEPTGDFHRPIVAYRLWAEDGGLLETVLPGQPRIVTLVGLESDSFHTFRVTAVDEDAEVIAVGTTEPVYLLPLLSDAYDPMPPDAIFIELNLQARSALQVALREMAGGVGSVTELPAILTVREGVADIFFLVEGLNRAISPGEGFEIKSQQLNVGSMGSDGLAVDLEISEGVRLSGTFDSQVDPSGVLFTLLEPTLIVSHQAEDTGDLIRGFSLSLNPATMSPGFEFIARISASLSGNLEGLEQPAGLGAIGGVVELRSNGVVLQEQADQVTTFIVGSVWLDEYATSDSSPVVLRVDGAGQLAVTARCERADEETAKCLAHTVGSVEGDTFFVLAVSAGKQTATPTPLPTRFAAPSEPSAPTPVSGPRLVVVEEWEQQATPAPTATAEPTPVPLITPTVAPPDLPGTGNRTTIVTWLMSGVLGLVVIRGAFYAVGKLRA